ncbi:MAG: WbuC family cupin fold metalloprotein [Victivallaceae bacterium]|nr:WbuC family cupin fold metalloprotein [Victivallaceae bacterium]
MKIVDDRLMDSLLEQAAANPRRRTNFNLHEDPAQPINRLCIAGWPDTEFPIHRHPGKWELMTLLRGRMTSMVYDDNGNVIESHELGGADGARSIELPDGAWHNLVFHEPSVFLEVKAGPYAPNAPEDVMTGKK